MEKKTPSGDQPGRLVMEDTVMSQRENTINLNSQSELPCTPLREKHIVIYLVKGKQLNITSSE